MGYQLSVDLGTTFTAAAVQRDGRAEIVPLGDHSAQVPSVVYLREDGELLIGDAAAYRAASEPSRTAREFKRRLGDQTTIAIGPAYMSPEALMSRLLRWVVQTVIQREGSAPDGIVLTHPANWGPFRRERFTEVINLAGIGKATTCTEPYAAALHFASTERVEAGEVIAVYDLGGGTFDAAVLRKTADGFDLLGTAQGIDHLGGVDFDDAIFEHVREALGPALRDIDRDDPFTVSALHRLRRECVEAKEVLSADTEATISVALPKLQTKVRITRAEFEQMVREPLEDSVGCLRRSVSSAGLTSDDVKAVILVGGSARIPLVSELLAHHIGRPIQIDPQPKLAVALGAALMLAPAVRVAETQLAPSPDQLDADVPVVTQPERTPSPEPSSIATPPPSTTVAARSHARLLIVLAMVLVLAFGLLARIESTPDVSVPKKPSTDFTENFTVAGAVAPGVYKLEIQIHALGVHIPLAWEGYNASTGGEIGDAGRLVGGPVRVTFYDKKDAKTTPNKTVRGQTILEPLNPILTVTAGILVVLALFVVAYAESILRPIRRRRRIRPVDYLAMTLMSALGGLVLVGVTWMTGGYIFTGGWLPSVYIVGILGACVLAGVSLTRLVAERSVLRAEQRPQRP